MSGVLPIYIVNKHGRSQYPVMFSCRFISLGGQSLAPKKKKKKKMHEINILQYTETRAGFLMRRQQH